MPTSSVARGTLLAVSERVARLQDALPQIHEVVRDETDPIAIQASLACLLFETLVQANWCGFYRNNGKRELVIGPYQGTLGCLRIPFARGVCGAAARTRQALRVPDVHQFADHIACDSRSRSELVLPVLDSQGALRAVLDLDSTVLDGFSAEEQAALEGLLTPLFSNPKLEW